MGGRGRGLLRDLLLGAVGLVALAALVAHAWVNARAAADFRALGGPPFECRWEAGRLWVTDVPAGAGQEIDLAPGDWIIQIGGVPVDGSERWRYPMLWRVNGRPLRRGQVLSLVVLREGEIREATVRLRGISPEQAREVTRIQRMMLPRQIAGFALWVLGVLVLVRRRDAVTRVFFLWCMALALYTASSAVAVLLWDSYPPGLITLFRIGFTVGWFFAPALFGHFCCAYAGLAQRSWVPGRPHPASLGTRRRLLPGLFYAMPLAVLLWPRVLAGGGSPAGLAGHVLWCGLAASWLGTLALGFVILARARRRTADPLRRRQIQLVFTGSLAYALVVLHAFITALAGLDVTPTSVWAWLPHILLLVTPLSFADAIVRHRLLDLNVVIRRSLVYTLLTICMGGVFIVLQQLVGAMLQPVPGSLPAQTFAAMIVAALFGPTERRIGRVVEALFNRQKRWRLQQLHRLGQEIGFIEEADRLKKLLVERAAHVFAVESAALHWRDAAAGEYRLAGETGLSGLGRAVSFRKDGGLAVWLALDRVPLEFAALQRDDRYRWLDAGEKERLAALGAALCVPLSVGGQLEGILTLGPRQDRELYCAEEKAALLAAGGLAAAALRQTEMEARLRALTRELRAARETGRKPLAEHGTGEELCLSASPSRPSRSSRRRSRR